MADGTGRPGTGLTLPFLAGFMLMFIGATMEDPIWGKISLIVAGIAVIMIGAVGRGRCKPRIRPED